MVGAPAWRAKWGRPCGGQSGDVCMEDMVGTPAWRTWWGRPHGGHGGGARVEGKVGAHAWRAWWGHPRGGQSGGARVEGKVGASAWRIWWGRPHGHIGGARMEDMVGAHAGWARAPSSRWGHAASWDHVLSGMLASGHAGCALLCCAMQSTRFLKTKPFVANTHLPRQLVMQERFK
eukprot:361751-Chlamydomonas_euryale.AAC.1